MEDAEDLVREFKEQVEISPIPFEGITFAKDKETPVEDKPFDRGQDPEYFDVSIDDMLPELDEFLTKLGNFSLRFSRLNFKSDVETVAKYDNAMHALNLAEYKLRDFESTLKCLKVRSKGE